MSNKNCLVTRAWHSKLGWISCWLLRSGLSHLRLHSGASTCTLPPSTGQDDHDAMAVVTLSCFSAKTWAFWARDSHHCITTDATKFKEVTGGSEVKVAHCKWTIILINWDRIRAVWANFYPFFYQEEQLTSAGLRANECVWGFFSPA